MGAPFTGRTGSQDEKTKAGANWKRLQKTLTTTTSPEDDGRVIKRSRRSSTSRPSSTTSRRITSVRAKDDKMKVAKIIDESNARDSASPAPTTLPWFAEDLSPEDLALVRKQSADRTPSKDSATDAGTSAVSVASLTDEEALRRRQLILGGKGLEQGQDATPDAAKAEAGKYVAIDCEMVGVGPNGSESVLARVSIVNWHGAVLLDTFVRTRETVTDYRTWVSGVRPADLRKAPSFDVVQANVAKLIEGRILVGHALHNDLRALLLSHPHWLIRDTASYSGARKIANTKYPSLRKLVALQLGIEIQQAGAPHSSVEDARATMALYRTFHAEWQKTLSSSVAARSTTRQQKNHGSSSSPQIIGKGWKAAAGATGKRDASSASISSTSGTTKKKRTSADDVDWWKTV